MLKDQCVTVHDMVEVVVTILDVRDPYTFEHSWRVAALAQRIAERMKVPPKWVEVIHIAAHLHDIGKVGVPDFILNKPGPLLDYEYELIKAHSRIGYTIIRKLSLLDETSLFILHHHERWDGKGYPAGISGKEIPLGARIIGAVDTFDAITSHRPYRNSGTVDDALAEIERSSGSQLCPEVCEVFLSLAAELPDFLASVQQEMSEVEGRYQRERHVS